MISTNQKENTKNLAIVAVVCLFWLIVYVLLLQITAFAIWGGAYWVHAGILSAILLLGLDIRTKRKIEPNIIITCIGSVIFGHVGLLTLITCYIIQWQRRKSRAKNISEV